MRDIHIRAPMRFAEASRKESANEQNKSHRYECSNESRVTKLSVFVLLTVIRRFAKYRYQREVTVTRICVILVTGDFGLSKLSFDVVGRGTVRMRMFSYANTETRQNLTS